MTEAAAIENLDSVVNVAKRCGELEGGMIVIYRAFLVTREQTPWNVDDFLKAVEAGLRASGYRP